MYEQLVSEYRNASTVEQLTKAYRSSSKHLLEAINKTPHIGYAAVLAYVYYHKTITGAEMGDGLFKGKPTQEYLDKIISIAKTKSGA